MLKGIDVSYAQGDLGFLPSSVSPEFCFITTIGAAVGWHDAPTVATMVTASAAFLGTLCGVSTLTAKEAR